MKTSQFLKAWCITVAGLFFGCAQDNVLMIEGASELLEAPYPMNYPSSSPKPNRVLRVVKDQEVYILQEQSEKDYLVYKVRTNSGEEGFIVARSNMHKKHKGKK